jgi:hypothetical protein
MSIKNTLVASASTTNIFTASTGTEYAITTMIFCNTDATVSASLNLWAVPYGSVAGGAINRLLNNVVIPPTETFIMDSEKLILGDRDALWAQVLEPGADQRINACVSYVTIS